MIYATNNMCCEPPRRPQKDDLQVTIKKGPPTSEAAHGGHVAPEASRPQDDDYK